MVGADVGDMVGADVSLAINMAMAMDMDTAMAVQWFSLAGRVDQYYRIS